MAWTTPEIIEICVGMEITSYRIGRDLTRRDRVSALRGSPKSKVGPSRRPGPHPRGVILSFGAKVIALRGYLSRPERD